jgi:hypothetical protein
VGQLAAWELAGDGRRSVEQSSREIEMEGREEDDEDPSVIFQKNKECTVK